MEPFLESEILSVSGMMAFVACSAPWCSEYYTTSFRMYHAQCNASATPLAQASLDHWFRQFLAIYGCLDREGGRGSKGEPPPPPPLPVEIGAQSIVKAMMENGAQAIATAPVESGARSIAKALVENGVQSIATAPLEDGAQSISKAPVENTDLLSVDLCRVLSAKEDSR